MDDAVIAGRRMLCGVVAQLHGGRQQILFAGQLHGAGRYHLHERVHLQRNRGGVVIVLIGVRIGHGRAVRRQCDRLRERGRVGVRDDDVL